MPVELAVELAIELAAALAVKLAGVMKIRLMPALPSLMTYVWRLSLCGPGDSRALQVDASSEAGVAPLERLPIMRTHGRHLSCQSGCHLNCDGGCNVGSQLDCELDCVNATANSTGT